MVDNDDDELYSYVLVSFIEVSRKIIELYYVLSGFV